MSTPVALLITPLVAQRLWLSLLFIGPARVRRAARPGERSPGDASDEA